MVRKTGNLATPLLSFRLTGAHASVCLMALKAKSQGRGDTALGTRVPPVSVNLSLPPPAPHPLAFFQSPGTGRAFLCHPPIHVPQLDFGFPFWGKTHGPRNKSRSWNGLRLRAFAI